MALSLRVILAAVLCAKALSEQDAENDVSLLQKSLHFGAEAQRGHQGMDLAQSRKQDSHPPELFVDLDVAPEKRWINVSRYYADLGVYPQYLQAHKDNFSSVSVRALLKAWQIDEDYMRELRGIVDTFRDQLNDPEATLDLLKFAQAGYELAGWREGPAGIAANVVPLVFDIAKEGGCSGLLAAMPNGTVVHGRNMDYKGLEVKVDGRSLYYPEVTIDVTFLRSGKPLVTSTHWPALTGIHTAIRHGSWSFEQNLRWHGMDSSFIYGILRNSKGYLLEVRKILETVDDFETAVDRLYGLNLMAPGYFIVAGTKPYQGAVITMDRGGLHVPRTPPVMRLGKGSPSLKDGQTYTGSWHLIQTNDDQGSKALDERRPTTELRLAESSQDMVSVDWVASQLSTPPLFHNNTVFTTIYVPGTGYHNTVLHHGHQR